MKGTVKRKLAIISDIHGNRWALEAVLQDIKRRGAAEIRDLGDSLYGPLDPAGTASILMAARIPSVRGNEDRLLLEASGRSGHSPTLDHTLRQVNEAVLEWLANRPVTATLPEGVLLCHGTPASDDTYLLEHVDDAGVRHRTGAELQQQLGPGAPGLVLCGHSHVFGQATLPGGRLVVNAGSVGLPAYFDGDPPAHAMESGTPHAVYALVEAAGDGSGWQARRMAVTYDWHAAAVCAERNGRRDWAFWLRTGRAGGPE